ncbi:hypothetical protein DPX16_13202 [Anabarilius grahami]|uniref:Uncharacterized protein n=1 Tax=Anabarilius grahami TaxID=495550 RepID=A0A3N0YMR9_ANAGA|nr:hypothetical protein DPX16_13202 [Anabarilius grahami]
MYAILYYPNNTKNPSTYKPFINKRLEFTFVLCLLKFFHNAALIPLRKDSNSRYIFKFSVQITRSLLRGKIHSSKQGITSKTCLIIGVFHVKTKTVTKLIKQLKEKPTYWTSDHYSVQSTDGFPRNAFEDAPERSLWKQVSDLAKMLRNTFPSATRLRIFFNQKASTICPIHQSTKYSQHHQGAEIKMNDFEESAMKIAFNSSNDAVVHMEKILQFLGMRLLRKEDIFQAKDSTAILEDKSDAKMLATDEILTNTSIQNITMASANDSKHRKQDSLKMFRQRRSKWKPSPIFFITDDEYKAGDNKVTLTKPFSQIVAKPHNVDDKTTESSVTESFKTERANDFLLSTEHLEKKISESENSATSRKYVNTVTLTKQQMGITTVVTETDCTTKLERLSAENEGSEKKTSLGSKEIRPAVGAVQETTNDGQKHQTSFSGIRLTTSEKGNTVSDIKHMILVTSHPDILMTKEPRTNKPVTPTTSREEEKKTGMTTELPETELITEKRLLTPEDKTTVERKDTTYVERQAEPVDLISDNIESTVTNEPVTPTTSREHEYTEIVTDHEMGMTKKHPETEYTTEIELQTPEGKTPLERRDTTYEERQSEPVDLISDYIESTATNEPVTPTTSTKYAGDFTVTRQETIMTTNALKTESTTEIDLQTPEDKTTVERTDTTYEERQSEPVDFPLDRTKGTNEPVTPNTVTRQKTLMTTAALGTESTTEIDLQTPEDKTPVSKGTHGPMTPTTSREHEHTEIVSDHETGMTTEHLETECTTEIDLKTPEAKTSVERTDTTYEERQSEYDDLRSDDFATEGKNETVTSPTFREHEHQSEYSDLSSEDLGTEGTNELVTPTTSYAEDFTVTRQETIMTTESLKTESTTGIDLQTPENKTTVKRTDTTYEERQSEPVDFPLDRTKGTNEPVTPTTVTRQKTLMTTEALGTESTTEIDLKTPEDKTPVSKGTHGPMTPTTSREHEHNEIVSDHETGMTTEIKLQTPENETPVERTDTTYEERQSETVDLISDNKESKSTNEPVIPTTLREHEHTEIVTDHETGMTTEHLETERTTEIELQTPEAKTPVERTDTTYIERQSEYDDLRSGDLTTEVTNEQVTPTPFREHDNTVTWTNDEKGMTTELRETEIEILTPEHKTAVTKADTTYEERQSEHAGLISDNIESKHTNEPVTPTTSTKYAGDFTVTRQETIMTTEALDTEYTTEINLSTPEEISSFQRVTTTYKERQSEPLDLTSDNIESKCTNEPVIPTTFREHEHTEIVTDHETGMTKEIKLQTPVERTDTTYEERQSEYNDLRSEYPATELTDFISENAESKGTYEPATPTTSREHERTEIVTDHETERTTVIELQTPEDKTSVERKETTYEERQSEYNDLRSEYPATEGTNELGTPTTSRKYVEELMETEQDRRMTTEALETEYTTEIDASTPEHKTAVERRETTYEERQSKPVDLTSESKHKNEPVTTTTSREHEHTEIVSDHETGMTTEHLETECTTEIELQTPEPKTSVERTDTTYEERQSEYDDLRSGDLTTEVTNEPVKPTPFREYEHTVTWTNDEKGMTTELRETEIEILTPEHKTAVTKADTTYEERQSEHAGLISDNIESKHTNEPVTPSTFREHEHTEIVTDHKTGMTTEIKLQTPVERTDTTDVATEGTNESVTPTTSTKYAGDFTVTRQETIMTTEFLQTESTTEIVLQTPEDKTPVKKTDITYEERQSEYNDLRSEYPATEPTDFISENAESKGTYEPATPTTSREHKHSEIVTDHETERTTVIELQTPEDKTSVERKETTYEERQSEYNDLRSEYPATEGTNELGTPTTSRKYAEELMETEQDRRMTTEALETEYTTEIDLSTPEHKTAVDRRETPYEERQSKPVDLISDYIESTVTNEPITPTTSTKYAGDFTVTRQETIMTTEALDTEYTTEINLSTPEEISSFQRVTTTYEERQSEHAGLTSDNIESKRTNEPMTPTTSREHEHTEIVTDHETGMTTEIKLQTPVERTDTTYEERQSEYVDLRSEDVATEGTNESVTPTTSTKYEGDFTVTRQETIMTTKALKTESTTEIELQTPEDKTPVKRTDTTYEERQLEYDDLRSGDLTTEVTNEPVTPTPFREHEHTVTWTKGMTTELRETEIEILTPEHKTAVTKADTTYEERQSEHAGLISDNIESKHTNEPVTPTTSTKYAGDFTVTRQETIMTTEALDTEYTTEINLSTPEEITSFQRVTTTYEERQSEHAGLTSDNIESKRTNEPVTPTTFREHEHTEIVTDHETGMTTEIKLQTPVERTDTTDLATEGTNESVTPTTSTKYAGDFTVTRQETIMTTESLQTESTTEIELQTPEDKTPVKRTDTTYEERQSEYVDLRSEDVATEGTNESVTTTSSTKYEGDFTVTRQETIMTTKALKTESTTEIELQTPEDKTPVKRTDTTYEERQTEYNDLRSEYPATEPTDFISENAESKGTYEPANPTTSREHKHSEIVTDHETERTTVIELQTPEEKTSVVGKETTYEERQSEYNDLRSEYPATEGTNELGTPTTSRKYAEELMETEQDRRMTTEALETKYTTEIDLSTPEHKTAVERRETTYEERQSKPVDLISDYIESTVTNEPITPTTSTKYAGDFTVTRQETIMTTEALDTEYTTEINLSTPEEITSFQRVTTTYKKRQSEPLDLTSESKHTNGPMTPTTSREHEHTEKVTDHETGMTTEIKLQTPVGRTDTTDVATEGTNESVTPTTSTKYAGDFTVTRQETIMTTESLQTESTTEINLSTPEEISSFQRVTTTYEERQSEHAGLTSDNIESKRTNEPVTPTTFREHEHTEIVTDHETGMTTEHLETECTTEIELQTPEPKTSVERTDTTYEERQSEYDDLRSGDLTTEVTNEPVTPTTSTKYAGDFTVTRQETIMTTKALKTESTTEIELQTPEDKTPVKRTDTTYEERQTEYNDLRSEYPATEPTDFISENAESKGTYEPANPTTSREHEHTEIVTDHETERTTVIELQTPEDKTSVVGKETTYEERQSEPVDLTSDNIESKHTNEPVTPSTFREHEHTEIVTDHKTGMTTEIKLQTPVERTDTTDVATEGTNESVTPTTSTKYAGDFTVTRQETIMKTESLQTESTTEIALQTPEDKTPVKRTDTTYEERQSEYNDLRSEYPATESTDFISENAESKSTYEPATPTTSREHKHTEIVTDHETERTTVIELQTPEDKTSVERKETTYEERQSEYNDLRSEYPATEGANELGTPTTSRKYVEELMETEQDRRMTTEALETEYTTEIDASTPEHKTAVERRETTYEERQSKPVDLTSESKHKNEPVTPTTSREHEQTEIVSDHETGMTTEHLETECTTEIELQTPEAKTSVERTDTTYEERQSEYDDLRSGDLTTEVTNEPVTPTTSTKYAGDFTVTRQETIMTTEALDTEYTTEINLSTPEEISSFQRVTTTYEERQSEPVDLTSDNIESKRTNEQVTPTTSREHEHTEIVTDHETGMTTEIKLQTPVERTDTTYEERQSEYVDLRSEDVATEGTNESVTPTTSTKYEGDITVTRQETIMTTKALKTESTTEIELQTPEDKTPVKRTDTTYEERQSEYNDLRSEYPATELTDFISENAESKGTYEPTTSREHEHTEIVTDHETERTTVIELQMPEDKTSVVGKETTYEERQSEPVDLTSDNIESKHTNEPVTPSTFREHEHTEIVTDHKTGMTTEIKLQTPVERTDTTDVATEGTNESVTPTTSTKYAGDFTVTRQETIMTTEAPDTEYTTEINLSTPEEITSFQRVTTTYEERQSEPLDLTSESKDTNGPVTPTTFREHEHTEIVTDHETGMTTEIKLQTPVERTDTTYEERQSEYVDLRSEDVATEGTNESVTPTTSTKYAGDFTVTRQETIMKTESLQTESTTEIALQTPEDKTPVKRTDTTYEERQSEYNDLRSEYPATESTDFISENAESKSTYEPATPTTSREHKHTEIVTDHETERTTVIELQTPEDKTSVERKETTYEERQSEYNDLRSEYPATEGANKLGTPTTSRKYVEELMETEQDRRMTTEALETEYTTEIDASTPEHKTAVERRETTYEERQSKPVDLTSESKHENEPVTPTTSREHEQTEIVSDHETGMTTEHLETECTTEIELQTPEAKTSVERTDTTYEERQSEYDDLRSGDLTTEVTNGPMTPTTSREHEHTEIVTDSFEILTPEDKTAVTRADTTYEERESEHAGLISDNIESKHTNEPVTPTTSTKYAGDFTKKRQETIMTTEAVETECTTEIDLQTPEDKTPVKRTGTTYEERQSELFISENIESKVTNEPVTPTRSREYEHTETLKEHEIEMTTEHPETECTTEIDLQTPEDKTPVERTDTTYEERQSEYNDLRSEYPATEGTLDFCFGLIHRTTSGLRRCQEKMIKMDNLSSELHATEGSNELVTPTTFRKYVEDLMETEDDKRMTTEALETECTTEVEVMMQEDKTSIARTSTYEEKQSDSFDLISDNIESTVTTEPVAPTTSTKYAGDFTEKMQETIMTTDSLETECTTEIELQTPVTEESQQKDEDGCFGLIHRTTSGLKRCQEKMIKMDNISSELHATEGSNELGTPTTFRKYVEELMETEQDRRMTTEALETECTTEVEAMMQEDKTSIARTSTYEEKQSDSVDLISDNIESTVTTEPVAPTTSTKYAGDFTEKMQETITTTDSLETECTTEIELQTPVIEESQQTDEDGCFGLIHRTTSGLKRCQEKMIKMDNISSELHATESSNELVTPTTFRKYVEDLMETEDDKIMTTEALETECTTEVEAMMQEDKTSIARTSTYEEKQSDSVDLISDNIESTVTTEPVAPTTSTKYAGDFTKKRQETIMTTDSLETECTTEIELQTPVIEESQQTDEDGCFGLIHRTTSGLKRCQEKMIKMDNISSELHATESSNELVTPTTFRKYVEDLMETEDDKIMTTEALETECTTEVEVMTQEDKTSIARTSTYEEKQSDSVDLISDNIESTVTTEPVAPTTSTKYAGDFTEKMQETITTTDSLETECTTEIELQTPVTEESQQTDEDGCFGLIHRTTSGLKRCQEKMIKMDNISSELHATESSNELVTPTTFRKYVEDLMETEDDKIMTTEALETECTTEVEAMMQEDKTSIARTSTYEEKQSDSVDLISDNIESTVTTEPVAPTTSTKYAGDFTKKRQETITTTDSLETECTTEIELQTPEDKTTVKTTDTMFEERQAEPVDLISDNIESTGTNEPVTKYKEDFTEKRQETTTTESLETECTTEIESQQTDEDGCFGLIHRNTFGLKRCQEKMIKIMFYNTTPKPQEPSTVKYKQEPSTELSFMLQNVLQSSPPSKFQSSKQVTQNNMDKVNQIEAENNHFYYFNGKLKRVGNHALRLEYENNTIGKS